MSKGSELCNNINTENWCQYPFKINLLSLICIRNAAKNIFLKIEEESVFLFC